MHLWMRTLAIVETTVFTEISEQRPVIREYGEVSVIEIFVDFVRSVDQR